MATKVPVDVSAMRRGFQADNQGDDDVERMVALLDAQDAAPSIERLRRWALDAAAPQPGHTVIDVGSGTGTMTRRLAATMGPQGSALGVEPNPKLRAVAQSRIDGPSSVSFVDGTADALPLPDDSVDLLWCERVLQHVADPQAALHEFARVLRAGGVAVLLDSDHGSRVVSDLPPGAHRSLAATFARMWPNPFAARALPRQVIAAGLLLDPDVGSAALILPGPVAVGLLRATLAAAVADGEMEAQQAADAVQTFSTAADVGVAFSAVTVFGFLARKPRHQPSQLSSD